MGTIANLFASIPGLKQDYKVDWKEDAKQDWKIDWDAAPGPAPAAPAPVNTALPVVSGAHTVGTTLTSANGTWTGSPAFTYKWERDGQIIAGATASTYTLVAADVDAMIRILVTGTNASGQATAMSAEVGPITA